MSRTLLEYKQLDSEARDFAETLLAKALQINNLTDSSQLKPEMIATTAGEIYHIGSIADLEDKILPTLFIPVRSPKSRKK